MASDPTEYSTTIEDLPNELITFIFEHLKIKDLYQCSFVCTRFEAICGCVKIPELVIRKKPDTFNAYWFYTNKKFSYRDAIDATTFATYRPKLGLNKIKRLHFEGSHSQYKQLDVNAFTQLEQLKIFIEYNEYFSYEVLLNLPRVKVIEISSGYSANARFHLSTPKLEALSCINFDCIDLTYPDTITHLQTTLYSESTHVLKNVRHFDVQSWFLQNRENRNVLSVFPKLTTLACSYFNYGNTVAMQNLRFLVDQKRKLGRPELKIYFNSVELDGTRRIDEYERIRDVFQFQIENLDLMAHTNTECTVVNYNELMDLVNGNIPDDVYKKYFSTKVVRVTGEVASQDHFFRFLNKFEYLTTVRLDSESLDQSFYDGLAEAQMSTKVSIENCSQTILNYDFLLKIEKLESFTTQSDSSKFFDLALTLFRQSDTFLSMHFLFNERLIRIGRSLSPSKFYFSRSVRNSHFEGMYNNRVELNFDGLARLVEKVRVSEVDPFNKNFDLHSRPFSRAYRHEYVREALLKRL